MVKQKKVPCQVPHCPVIAPANRMWYLSRRDPAGHLIIVCKGHAEMDRGSWRPYNGIRVPNGAG
jgi:hypothetical protein